MKDLILSILNIFKYTGKVFTTLRNLVFNLLFVLVVILVIVSLVPRKGIHVSPNTILDLTLSGNIVEEKRVTSAFEKMYLPGGTVSEFEAETLLQDILDIIDGAAADKNITVMRLDLKHLNRAGLNQLREIGRALNNFKATGKRIIAAQDNYTQIQYYLAAHANTVILNPMGTVFLHGFGVYHLYFKQALDKLMVNYNIFKVGTYKSALEPLTRDSMSPEDRKQTREWLTALWQLYSDDINKLRPLKPLAIQKYTTDIAAQLESTGGDSGGLALKLGLVDKLLTREQISLYFTKITGRNHDSLKTNHISSENYLTLLRNRSKSTFNQDKIGVLVAEGNIVPGEQPAGIIGGDSLSKLIHKARKDKSIKALVLRINSGGGSAFASEIIRQELLEFKKSGKPLVVSMGAVAASGGYWIAANADEIWASPATITGSIGIFGAVPTFEKTLSTYGIHSDGTGTTPLASGINLARPLSEPLKAAIHLTITRGYDQFINIVSTGRKLEKSYVQKIARGRVYDGRAAVKLGLVDRLGSLDDSVKAAAKLAGLEKFKKELLHRPVSVRDLFIRYLTNGLGKTFFTIKREIPQPLLRLFSNKIPAGVKDLLQLSDPCGMYAYSFIAPAL
ncbi:signal peptide peptidase SppA [Desulfomarina sp.]